MKSTPLAGLALYPDPPTMHLHKLLTDRKSQSRSLSHAVGSNAHLVELVKDLRSFFVGNADPGIRYRHANELLVRHHRNIYGDGASGCRELHGVAEQIVENLSQTEGVRGN